MGGLLVARSRRRGGRVSAVANVAVFSVER